MLENKKDHENEVSLRLKFETKLNSLHAIHWEIEHKYERAKIELEGFKGTKDYETWRLFEIRRDYQNTKETYLETAAKNKF